MQETRVQSWVRKIPWERKWQSTLTFLPGESHGQRSLGGYSPWSHKSVVHDLAIKQHFIPEKTERLGSLQKGNTSKASELALKHQPAPKPMLSVFTPGCVPMQRRGQMSGQHLKTFCVPCRHRPACRTGGLWESWHVSIVDMLKMPKGNWFSKANITVWQIVSEDIN